MTLDPRLHTYLKLARARCHPFYARQAWRFAIEAGDEEATQEALALGALLYRPEPLVRAWTEMVQLRFWEEAA